MQVDFALCKFTSPAFDLNLLLYGNIHQSSSQAECEQLIQFYHIELAKLLQKLNYPKKIPSLLEIQSVTFRIDFYNILLILLVIGLRYVGKSYDGGFIEMSECMQDNDETGMYSQPECKEKLKYMLDLFDRRGYLDY